MKTILTLTGITIGFIGALFINQSFGADLAIEKCPACPDCKITAGKIISDNPDIDLTKYDNVTKFKLPDKEGMEIEIGDKIYKKEKYNPDTLVLDEEILKQK